MSTPSHPSPPLPSLPLSADSLLSIRLHHVPTNVKLNNSPYPLCVSHGIKSYLYGYPIDINKVKSKKDKDNNNNNNNNNTDDSSPPPLLKYLDAINNVTHLGHSSSFLSHIPSLYSSPLPPPFTNTRYHHNTLPRFIHNILHTFPSYSRLSYESDAKVICVNSGTEANEIAVRVAEGWGREKGRGKGNLSAPIIVMDHSYHGHSTHILSLSPYKFNNKQRGGQGKSPHVIVLPLPDLYRGKYRLSDAMIEQYYECSDDNNNNSNYNNNNICSDDRKKKRARLFKEIDHLTNQYIHDAQHYLLSLLHSSPSSSPLSLPASTLLIESIPSCGGQFYYPPLYLSRIIRWLRGANYNENIVVIGDEVQTGMGRMGYCYYGYQIYRDKEREYGEEHDGKTKENNNYINDYFDDQTIPFHSPSTFYPLYYTSPSDHKSTPSIDFDILTLGKPLGNGYPIGVAIISNRLSLSFERTKMEYYNTFGGGPLGMEMAMGVMRGVGRKEEGEGGLMENARMVGEYWMGRLKEISREINGKWKRSRLTHSNDDDIKNLSSPPPPLSLLVRGIGLFIGIEIIRDPLTREPATEECQQIVNMMRDTAIPSHRQLEGCNSESLVNGILVGTDGPYDNVIKMKPPMCFTKENVEEFCTIFRIAMDNVKGKRKGESNVKVWDLGSEIEKHYEEIGWGKRGKKELRKEEEGERRSKL